jgi:hypothetical protein
LRADKSDELSQKRKSGEKCFLLRFGEGILIEAVRIRIG